MVQSRNYSTENLQFSLLMKRGLLFALMTAFSEKEDRMVVDDISLVADGS